MTLFSIMLWLAVVQSGGIATAADDDVFETIIAAATDESPRNSEGDIVVLSDGSLLAAWTEFYGGARDDSAARISAKHSTDSGKTWGERFVLRENTGKQNVMSASFLRLSSGELLLFYLEKHSRSDLDGVVVRSGNDGKAWSQPILITPEDGYFVTNNARVVQLSSGRIVAPFAYTPEVWKKGNVFKTVCYYSDDGGETWTRGKGECSAPKRGAMEPGLIEKADGTVLQIIRTQMGKQWFAESKDGCNTWTEAKPWTVVSPEAPATLAKLPGDRGWLVLHNPTIDPTDSHNGARTPLVAAISKDEGQTWSKPKAIESSPADTYSYISVDFHDGRALITYYLRHGKNDLRKTEKISWKFKSVPLDWFAE
jgi:sialidase-1